MAESLGFPTANVEVPPFHVVPATGIYAGHAILGGESHEAAISVGYNPTFGKNPLSVEAYLLDFEEDIYDRKLHIDFEKRIREEIRFSSTDELITQMQRDVDQVRVILESPVEMGASGT